MAKAETQYTTVKMDDGRTVDFAGRRKMLKESTISDKGIVTVRLDFLSGETRTFTLPETLLNRFAAHGAEQKLGDEIAGLEDIDDCVLAVDDLCERLKAGNWGMVRTSNGMAGTSVLARALVEQSGKSMDVIKAFLSAKSQAEKVALRLNVKLAPIVARLEAEKAGKSKVKVDTDSMLEELE